MPRMVSCSRCGRIHPAGECTRPSQRPKKKGREPDKFRSTWAWTQKSLAIRKRDGYCCQACLANLDGKGARLTSTALSVHHIQKLSEAKDLALDGCNLITLCEEHHVMADEGLISAADLRELARAREEAL